MTCFSAVPPPPASAPRLSTSKPCRASNSSNQRWLEVPILRNAKGSARSRSGNRAPAGQYRTGSRGSAAVAMAMSVKRPECPGVVQDRLQELLHDPSGLRVLNVADADQGDRRRACRGRRCSQSVAAVAVRTLQVRQRGCRRVGNDLRSTEWGHCGDGSAWRARQAWRTTDGLFQHDRVAHQRAGRLDAERREPDNTVGADSRHHLQLTAVPQLVVPLGRCGWCASLQFVEDGKVVRLVADIVATLAATRATPRRPWSRPSKARWTASSAMTLRRRTATAGSVTVAGLALGWAQQLSLPWDCNPTGRFTLLANTGSPLLDRSLESPIPDPRLRFRTGHFTPCIKRWINGAIRNSATPAPTSAQKPKV